MTNPSYPSNRTNRATNYLSMFDRVVLPYNKRPIKPLFYTASKNFIYQHTLLMEWLEQVLRDI